MNLGIPFDEIAHDAMDGKRVTVFCDNATQAKWVQDDVLRSMKQMDVHKVVANSRNRSIRVGDGVVHFLLLSGYDGRGLDADVVYLSVSARKQYEYASIVQAEVR